MPWRRSFNRVSIPHDGLAWNLSLLVLNEDETLDSMWVGVQHRAAITGPDFVDVSANGVLMHGLILVPPPPAPVPAPLNDPFEDWLLRDMAQWSSDTQVFSTTQGLTQAHWSDHPTQKFEGKRTNQTGAQLTLFLSVQTTNDGTAEFRENMQTRVHVEAFILD